MVDDSGLISMPATADVAGRLQTQVFYADRVTSTNDVLAQISSESFFIIQENALLELPDGQGFGENAGAVITLVTDLPELRKNYSAEFQTLISDNQQAGKGRLDRTWVAPPGRALAISTRLSPKKHGLDLGQYSWMPLIAGEAMRHALAVVTETQHTFVLKWPNDVLVQPAPDEDANRSNTKQLPRPGKICGVLVELQANGDLIVGVGVNLSQNENQLPVPTATSLALALPEWHSHHESTAADRIVAAYLTRLSELYLRYCQSEANPVTSSIQQTVSENCLTIGKRVRVLVNGKPDREGLAIAIATNGEILIRFDDSPGEISSISAADITHLRDGSR